MCAIHSRRQVPSLRFAALLEQPRPWSVLQSSCPARDARETVLLPNSRKANHIHVIVRRARAKDTPNPKTNTQKLSQNTPSVVLAEAGPACPEVRCVSVTGSFSFFGSRFVHSWDRPAAKNLGFQVWEPLRIVLAAPVPDSKLFMGPWCFEEPKGACPAIS